MSMKAECPACKSYRSVIWEMMQGERVGACPSCGLPASVMREIEKARKANADAELTAKLEETLIRAGKAEGEAALLSKHLTAIRKAVADAPTPDSEYNW
jgi:hypothetical protein